MGGMWIWMVLGLAALWLLVWFGVRSVVGPRTQPPNPTALQALDQRLARGEITTEEYRQVREALATTHSSREGQA